MLICDYCFNDEELQLAIGQEHGVPGVCEACGRESLLVNADVLSDFFGEVLAFFVPCADGVDVVTLLQQDWNLFVNAEVGRKIVAYFLTVKKMGYSISDDVTYFDTILQAVGIWDELKKDVKNKSRFFSNLSAFDELGLMRYNLSIPMHTTLFRARVIPADKTRLEVHEMGCPPAEKATAGRANPLGIPYLYLCKEEVTTYYEVRALYLDKLAIGSFSTLRDLHMMDFTKSLSLYVAHTQSDDLVSEVSKHLLLQRISNDLSKPLRRFDTELEYVPTQLICEYYKLVGIDGIMFNSSLHKGGVNVVLFDAHCAACVEVKQIEIQHVSISADLD